MLVTALHAGAGESLRTVCTITVNSADEREAFREHLPAEKFRFVELVERGRTDWLASACRKQVRCDVLLVSGHFAGTEFYSSKPQASESLPIEELERVACSQSCPDLFANLKEVYLFGCDTLKPEAVKSATPEIVRGWIRAGRTRPESERLARVLSAKHAESSRERMRRTFPGVPLLYGFTSLAPYGRVAGPMLQGFFRSGEGAEIGSGVPNAALLSLFGPSSLVATHGWTPGETHSEARATACHLHDDAVAPAGKVQQVHAWLRSEGTEVRMAFDRVEKFVGTLDAAARAEAKDALFAIEHDRPTRGRYLALTRETGDPALRVRMISLARGLGWLTPEDQRVELARLVGDMIAAGDMGYGEVDLVCSLNADRSLDAQLVRLGVKGMDRTASAAALACLGHRESRRKVLKALASPNEGEVQVAQAYLRHRPLDNAGELRTAALGIARMPPTPAQVRALDALARHPIADPAIIEELTALYHRAAAPAVQRAVAEVFLRSGIASPVVGKHFK